MKIVIRVALTLVLSVACIFNCIGFASVVEVLNINASATVKPDLPDVYITDVTPGASAGVTLTNTSGTTFVARVDGSGSATFNIDVVNISDKVYIFERVIDGAEVDIDGVYNGTEITYSLSGLSQLDEIYQNGGTLSFNLTINVPRGVTADCYILKFNFIEKTGTEILPGNDQYTVTFKYNNGQPDTSRSIHANEFIPRPATPVRAGYEFVGWYVDAALTDAWNFDADRVSGNMTLYAGWRAASTPSPEPTEYKVTFKPNNGDADTVVSVLPGEHAPIPQTPVLDGYLFVGWYTDAACTSAWNFDSDRVHASMTLYGGWELYVPPVPPELYITFKPNNGDADRTIIVMTGDLIPRPEAPQRDGYTFTGWYTDESYTEAWNFEALKPDGDMTLYGGWEVYIPPVVVQHTITFKLNNGQPDTTATVEDGSLIPVQPTPTRSGYTFIGWYRDSACTSPWNMDIDKPTSDMTLYAGWEKTEVAPEGGLHGDLLGLVEALLSTRTNCLNNSNVIFNAVMQSLDSSKRPDEDAPILHSSVNSISGGTMSDVASYANSNLTEEYEFLFEADPENKNTRMYLYMYYASDIDKANDGDRIMVYKQVVTRRSDGVWIADGTYRGTAVVGDFFGGGKNGKDVNTISPYTWQADAAPSAEE